MLVINTAGKIIVYQEIREFPYGPPPIYRVDARTTNKNQRDKNNQVNWGTSRKNWVFNLILKLFNEILGSRRCTAGSAFQAADEAK